MRAPKTLPAERGSRFSNMVEHLSTSLGDMGCRSKRAVIFACIIVKPIRTNLMKLPGGEFYRTPCDLICNYTAQPCRPWWRSTRILCSGGIHWALICVGSQSVSTVDRWVLAQTKPLTCCAIDTCRTAGPECSKVHYPHGSGARMVISTDLT